MIPLFVACGLLAAAGLACSAPYTAHGKHFDLAAGLVFVGTLALAGMQLPLMA